MHFKIVGRIADIEVIAAGNGIRERLTEVEGYNQRRIFGWRNMRS